MKKEFILVVLFILIQNPLLFTDEVDLSKFKNEDRTFQELGFNSLKQIANYLGIDEKDLFTLFSSFEDKSQKLDPLSSLLKFKVNDLWGFLMVMFMLSYDSSVEESLLSELKISDYESYNFMVALRNIKKSWGFGSGLNSEFWRLIYGF